MASTWILGIAGAAGLLSLTANAYAQQAVVGQRQFAARCAACHTATPGARSVMGPNLSGLAGQRSGTRRGFASSAALKKAAIIWNLKSLDSFLAAPTKTVPGTRMVTNVSDATVRANIVAYLLAAK